MSNEQTIKRNVQKLQRTIVDALEGVKGQDIQVFNTEALSPLFERVIVASGTSNRQTRALAMAVRDAVKDEGFPKPRVEGEDNGEWIIVDCGIAVVHVMQPVIRQYYRLEELWGETPVRLGRAGPKSGNTHSETFAREAVAAGASTGAAGKTSARKTAAGSTAKAPATSASKAKTTSAAAPKKRSTTRVKDDAPLREAVKATVKAQPANKSEAARPASKVPAKKAAAKKVAGSSVAKAPAKTSVKTPARKASSAKVAAGTTKTVAKPAQAVKTVVVAKTPARGGANKVTPARKSVAAGKSAPARKAPAKRA